MRNKYKKFLKKRNFYLLKLVITLLSMVTAVPHKAQLNIRHSSNERSSTTTTEINLLVE